MRVRFLLVNLMIVGLAVGGLSLDARAELRPPEGEARRYEAKDHGRHKHTGRFTLEDWTYVLEVSTGDVYFISYYYSNIWFLPPFCGVEISWTKQGTNPYLYGRKESSDLFKESSGAKRIEFGPKNWIAGVPPGKHRIHAMSSWRGGIEIDVSFSRMWPGFIIGDGMFRVGEGEKRGAMVMSGIPRARFKGTVIVDGEEIKVKGWAYMNRGFYQTLPTTLFDHRHSVNARFKDRSILSLRWRTAPGLGGETATFVTVVGKKGVKSVHRDVSSNFPSKRKEKRCEYPRSFLFSAEGFRFGGKSPEPLQVWRLSDLVSRMTELAMRAVMGYIPVMVRSHVVVELEEMVNGEKRRLSGKGIQRVDCSAR